MKPMVSSLLHSCETPLALMFRQWRSSDYLYIYIYIFVGGGGGGWDLIVIFLCKRTVTIS